MKVARGFMRIGRDPTPEEWQYRVDSLLCAEPSELMEFVCDAILVMAIRRDGGDVAGMIELLQGACTLPGTDSVLEMVRARWLDIESSLGEHMSKDDIRATLGRVSREAPWEVDKQ